MPPTPRFFSPAGRSCQWAQIEGGGGRYASVRTKQGITGRAQGARLEKKKRSSGDIRESIPAVQMERKSVMLAGFR